MITAETCCFACET